MADKNFEDKLKDLEKLIDEIESGKDGLNTSIEKYSEAQKLADELAEMLSDAKESLDLEEEEE
ncbi:MAG: exodeoxyribonuclease VII small subunit [Candidatus Nomurabacteria bacterium]|mgnify:CR=1 FL=1|nr:MAG: exodeoxyribonuclease VII small subunit [Candidatus Nomurabacteria bacterium]HRV75783.1 exodeoxyribonuclease VII small subunit [Candidatus Saccharimonadales bacterium]